MYTQTHTPIHNDRRFLATLKFQLLLLWLPSLLWLNINTQTIWINNTFIEQGLDNSFGLVAIQSPTSSLLHHNSRKEIHKHIDKWDSCVLVSSYQSRQEGWRSSDHESSLWIPALLWINVTYKRQQQWAWVKRVKPQYSEIWDQKRDSWTSGWFGV